MDKTLKAAIDEVHRRIVNCTRNIVTTLLNQKSFNASGAKELLIFANQLFALVPAVSRPSWLEPMLDSFNGKELRTDQGQRHGSDFATFLLSNIRDIEAPIRTPDEVNYDFDLAFNEVREAADIPTTFDNLIETLEQIIAADLIDSRVVQEALDRLMALLKRNKHGSLTSILVSIHYGRFALKTFFGALAANKYLKPMVDAFKEEFAVAEAKVQKAEETLKEEAIRRLTNQDRLIAFLTQNSEGKSSVAGYLGTSAENDGTTV